MKPIRFTLLFALVLAGCARGPESVPTAYMPSAVYAHMDCHELLGETHRVMAHANLLTEAQRLKARNDAMAVGWGIVVPFAGLMLYSGADVSPQLSLAKGELDAIVRAGRRRGCIEQRWAKRYPGEFPPL